MGARHNELGQPIGWAIEDWKPRDVPAPEPMRGRSCRLEPADPARHLESLWSAVSADAEGRMWTYLPYGPFESIDAYRTWMLSTCTGADPLFFAILAPEGDRALGLASFLRIDARGGAIEVGALQFSPELQRSTLATEAMFLMMRRVFQELGYRRYEWKCDALNAASRRAAERLGFRFEGIFRQATVYKGRNRDTAWYSILDSEWPALDASFRRWLDPSNFHGDGRQRTPLSRSR